MQGFRVPVFDMSSIINIKLLQCIIQQWSEAL